MSVSKRSALVIAVFVLIGALGLAPRALHAAMGQVILDTIVQGDDGVSRTVLIYQNQTYRATTGDMIPSAELPDFTVGQITETSVTIIPVGGLPKVLTTSY